jgi:double-GTPase-like protein
VVPRSNSGRNPSAKKTKGIAVLGLRSSGKTNFIYSLARYSTMAAEMPWSFEPNSPYTNRWLREMNASYERGVPTPSQGIKELFFRVERKGAAPVMLQVSDPSGEEVQSWLDDAQDPDTLDFKAQFEDYFVEAEGYVVLVDPERVVKDKMDQVLFCTALVNRICDAVGKTPIAFVLTKGDLAKHDPGQYSQLSNPEEFARRQLGGLVGKLSKGDRTHRFFVVSAFGESKRHGDDWVPMHGRPEPGADIAQPLTWLMQHLEDARKRRSKSILAILLVLSVLLPALAFASFDYAQLLQARRLQNPRDRLLALDSYLARPCLQRQSATAESASLRSEEASKVLGAFETEVQRADASGSLWSKLAPIEATARQEWRLLGLDPADERLARVLDRGFKRSGRALLRHVQGVKPASAALERLERAHVPSRLQGSMIPVLSGAVLRDDGPSTPLGRWQEALALQEGLRGLLSSWSQIPEAEGTRLKDRAEGRVVSAKGEWYAALERASSTQSKLALARRAHRELGLPELANVAKRIADELSVEVTSDWKRLLAILDKGIGSKGRAEVCLAAARFLKKHPNSRYGKAAREAMDAWKQLDRPLPRWGTVTLPRPEWESSQPRYLPNFGLTHGFSRVGQAEAEAAYYTFPASTKLSAAFPSLVLSKRHEIPNAGHSIVVALKTSEFQGVLRWIPGRRSSLALLVVGESSLQSEVVALASSLRFPRALSIRPRQLELVRTYPPGNAFFIEVLSGTAQSRGGPMTPSLAAQALVGGEALVPFSPADRLSIRLIRTRLTADDTLLYAWSDDELGALDKRMETIDLRSKRVRSLLLELQPSQ